MLIYMLVFPRGMGYACSDANGDHGDRTLR